MEILLNRIKWNSIDVPDHKIYEEATDLIPKVLTCRPNYSFMFDVKTNFE